jgi:NADH-quinone oxidoreductase subunit M
MTMNDIPLLSILIVLPLAGSALVLLLAERWARTVSLAAALLTFLVTLALLYLFRTGQPGFQFVEHHPWVGALGFSSCR